MIRNNFWRLVLLYGLIWTILWAMFRSIEYDGFTMEILWMSALQGAVMGTIWAFAMKLLPSEPFKNVRLDLEPDEILIKEGGAYLMKGKNGDGGKLALTDRRLIYKESKYASRQSQHIFLLEEIRNLKVVKSWFLLKNELQFEYEGLTQRFANDSPDQWISAIERQMDIVRPDYVQT